MSDSTQALSPELIEALVKALEPKLEAMVEAHVKKLLTDAAPESGGVGTADPAELVEQTKTALADLDVKLWVVENDTRRRFEELEDFVRIKRRP